MKLKEPDRNLWSSRVTGFWSDYPHRPEISKKNHAICHKSNSHPFLWFEVVLLSLTRSPNVTLRIMILEQVRCEGYVWNTEQLASKSGYRQVRIMFCWKIRDHDIWWYPSGHIRNPYAGFNAFSSWYSGIITTNYGRYVSGITFAPNIFASLFGSCYEFG